MYPSYCEWARNTHKERGEDYMSCPDRLQAYRNPLPSGFWCEVLPCEIVLFNIESVNDGVNRKSSLKNVLPVSIVVIPNTLYMYEYKEADILL